MTYGLTYGLMVKIFVRCTTRHLKENSLKISAQSIQPFRRRCPDKIFKQRDGLNDRGLLKVSFDNKNELMSFK